MLWLVAQMGEIYLIRQKAREFFEPSNTGSWARGGV